MANNLSVPANIPSLGSEGNLSRYLQEIRQFPMLEPEEEYIHSKRWREHGDSDAAHRILTRPLLLVANIVLGSHGYVLQLSDLIAAGQRNLLVSVRCGSKPVIT